MAANAGMPEMTSKGTDPAAAVPYDRRDSQSFAISSTVVRELSRGPGRAAAQGSPTHISTSCRGHTHAHLSCTLRSVASVLPRWLGSARSFRACCTTARALVTDVARSRRCSDSLRDQRARTIDARMSPRAAHATAAGAPLLAQLLQLLPQARHLVRRVLRLLVPQAFLGLQSSLQQGRVAHARRQRVPPSAAAAHVDGAHASDAAAAR